MISSVGTHTLRALAPQTAVAVDRSSCVRHRCRKNECSRCIDVCPNGALSWGGSGMTVSAADCRLCLSCLAVCPTAALSAPESSLPQTLADLSEYPAPVLGCKLRSESLAHGRFQCLGCLAHPELMLLLSLIYKEGLQINLTGCRECPNGHILQSVKSTYDDISKLVENHKLDLVSSPDKLNYRPPAISRRKLFSLFRERSTRSAAVVVERLQTENGSEVYGNKKLPLVRALLLKMLESSPEELSGKIAEQFSGRISYTDTCTNCGGCAGICSTGAIQTAQEDETNPEFNAEKCVSCGSCQAFCPKQGVRLLSTDMHAQTEETRASA